MDGRKTSHKPTTEEIHRVLRLVWIAAEVSVCCYLVPRQKYFITGFGTFQAVTMNARDELLPYDKGKYFFDCGYFIYGI